MGQRARELLAIAIVEVPGIDIVFLGRAPDTASRQTDLGRGAESGVGERSHDVFELAENGKPPVREARQLQLSAVVVGPPPIDVPPVVPGGPDQVGLGIEVDRRAAFLDDLELRQDLVQRAQKAETHKGSEKDRVVR